MKLEDEKDTEHLQLGTVAEANEKILIENSVFYFGPVTEYEKNSLNDQLASLANLIRRVSDQSPEFWTDRQRSMYQYYPEEVLAQLKEESLTSNQIVLALTNTISVFVLFGNPSRCIATSMNIF